jgi:short-subunit dehydrogenase involved in D-alanine esterification of teichoic acids
MKCHPLTTYLDGVRSFLEFDPSIESVIVTSEDKSACDEFIDLLKRELPQLRVVVNVGDVQQGKLVDSL